MPGNLEFAELILKGIEEIDITCLDAFSCSRPNLDDFLKEEALGYAQYGLTATTVVFRPDDPCPIAYFSLSSDALKLATSEKFDLGLPFETAVSYFPAVKITRLAVSEEFHGQGLGPHLINMIEGMVFKDHISTRLLTVDAANEEKVLRMYRRSGFVDSLEKEHRQHPKQKKAVPETIAMYKDLYAE